MFVIKVELKMMDLLKMDKNDSHERKRCEKLIANYATIKSGPANKLLNSKVH